MKPKTMEELLTSSKFRTLITARIQAEHTNRQKTLDGAANEDPFFKQKPVTFKSDPFSRLMLLEKLNPDDLITEFLLIDNRQSELPSGLRNYIYILVVDALRETEEYYHKGKEAIYN